MFDNDCLSPFRLSFVVTKLSPFCCNKIPDWVAYTLLFSRPVVSDFAIPWTAALQTSLSLSISQSLPKFAQVHVTKIYFHCSGVVNLRSGCQHSCVRVVFWVKDSLYLQMAEGTSWLSTGIFYKGTIPIHQGSNLMT